MMRAGRRTIDGVIMARVSRPRIARALVMLCTKMVELPPRKHDNLPV